MKFWETNGGGGEILDWKNQQLRVRYILCCC
jgi:hypothetical protein